MSLFKARNLWSFDLNQLEQHIDASASHGNTSPTQTTSATIKQEATNQQVDDQQESLSANSEGDFVVDWGHFSSVGDQGVFVCANLTGFVCIVQVPQSVQQKWSTSDQISLKSTTKKGPSHEKVADSPISDLENRQLLAVSRLNLPIVDLKCGYFNSTLKQTIAILSFDKLTLFQVKKRKIDLISATFDSESASETQTINEALLSHELEEIYTVELLGKELAQRLLVLGNRSENHSTRGNEQYHRRETDDIGSERQQSISFKQGAETILPQRDKILVQYANQFLITLVDSKKILSHFLMKPPDFSSIDTTTDEDGPAEVTNHDKRTRLMSEYVGCMPIAYLNDARDSLVVSFSDYMIYSLPLDLMIKFAKKSVMQRIAINLLHEGVNDPNGKTKTIDKSGESTPHNLSSIVHLDLESDSDWSLELVSSPIQMLGIQRCGKDRMVVGREDSSIISQLLILSRYNLDLFSSNGHHLWSHRFETPLIHVYAYTIGLIENQSATSTNMDRTISPERPQIEPATSGSRQSNHRHRSGHRHHHRHNHNIRLTDQIISLTCSDNMSSDSCDLIIMEENRITWSSLINCKPISLMRVHTRKMPGLIATLDVKQSQLNLSYLGTNSELNDEDRTLYSGNDSSDDKYLAQMEQFDQIRLSKDCNNEIPPILGTKLRMDVKFESIKDWPNSRIDCILAILPDASSTDALYKMTIIMEFDDLIKFEPSEYPMTIPSRGVVQIQLGNYWPDRRNPIQLKGCFSMIASRAVGTIAMEQIDTNRHHADPGDFGRLPRSLEVKVYLSFSTTNAGALMQEGAFLLPHNLVSRLIYVDFSSGQEQDLDEVLGNLENMSTSLSDETSVKPGNLHPLNEEYFIDSFLLIKGDIVDVVDDLIESDLVCRGIGRDGSRRSKQQLGLKDDSVIGDKNRLATIENINLLVQSLDCCPRFVNSNGLTGSSLSEELTQPVMASVGLRCQHIPGELNSIRDSNFELHGNNRKPVEGEVWIHLCDLSCENGSTIPGEMVERHRDRWARYSERVVSEVKTVADNSTGVKNSLVAQAPIMLTIESQHPLLVLFFHSHIINRLKRRLTRQEFDPSIVDAIVGCPASTQIDFGTLLFMGNSTATSSALHDHLKLIQIEHNEELMNKFRALKDKLAQEFCKLNITTNASLSMSKRLYSLSDTMQLQYKSLMALTKQYQQSLIKLLNELDNLKRLDREFSKIPDAPGVMVEVEKSQRLQKWKKIERIID